jgi:hypothetical protein
MSCLANKKILFIFAIWLMTGGLSLASTFDLTDELQSSFLDRVQVVETDLDEVRDLVEDAHVPTAYVCPVIVTPAKASSIRPRMLDLPSHVETRSLYERLCTLRI